MGTLGRFRASFHDFTGGSRLAGTRSHAGAGVSRTAAIDHLVNSSSHVVGNIQRAVRAHGEAAGTMLCSVWRFHSASKAIRENFAGTASMIAVERLVYHVVTALRIRRAIPGSVESDEHTSLVMLGKLLRAVINHGVGRPMRRECRNGCGLVRAYADLLAAVPAVLRREHQ